MRISHNYIFVYYLLIAFMQISIAEISKIPKVQKEYDFMCGCKNVFYKNQFEPSEDHFGFSTPSNDISYSGQSDKIVTSRSDDLRFLIPDEVVKCYMAGRYSRLTGYFLTEPKKYFKIWAECYGDTSGRILLETKNFSGTPFWRKFDFYFDLVGKTDVKKIAIYAKSPVDLAEEEADDTIYPLYLDEFRICRYCDGTTSDSIPALKKLEANTGELISLSENNYTLNVSTETRSLKIKPIIDTFFTGCTIKVNNSIVSSGSFSQDISLNSDPGKTTFIYVEVTKSVCERNIYIIEVKKNGDPDATLSNLKTTEGVISPIFYRFQNNYTIMIDKDVSILKLIPYANDPKATIKVDNSIVESATETDSIDVSNNRVITIEVTARDGITKRTYNVTVLHEGPRISFVTTSSSGTESDSNPVISVSITPPPDSGQTVTVEVIAKSGTAEDGVDFALPPVVLTFDNTNLIQSFQLNIIDDTIGEPDEKILLALVNATGRAIIGKYGTHEYTIMDNKPAIWVRCDIDTSGNGATWNTAFKYLQDALKEANKNKSIQTIRIAKGYYYPDQYHDSLNNFVDSDNNCSSFELRDNLTLVGGYITEIKRDGGALNNQTYLDGNISDPDSFTITANHLIKMNSSGSQNSLHSITIQNGHQTGVGCGRPEGAGAIYSNANKIKLVDCYLRNNSGKDMGAVYVEDGTFIANNCIFESNSSNYGGAILTRGQLRLENCQFYDNSATYGGAILIENDSGATHTINGCKFQNNKAFLDGAAINHVGKGNLNIENSVFNGNNGRYGSAILFDNSAVLKISNNSVFKNNITSLGGCVDIKSASNLIVENSIFENNTNSGGAISIESNASNITKTTFTNNFSIVPNGAAAIRYGVCDTNHIITECIFINNKPKDTNCP